MSVIDKLRDMQKTIDTLRGRKYKRRRNTGATEEKMKKALAKPIAEAIFGVPTPEQIQKLQNEMQLYPATGYWRHKTQDVMSFTGTVYIDGNPAATIGSWESMTQHLRNGFRVIDGRGDRLAYADFECTEL